MVCGRFRGRFSCSHGTKRGRLSAYQLLSSISDLLLLSPSSSTAPFHSIWRHCVPQRRALKGTHTMFRDHGQLENRPVCGIYGIRRRLLRTTDGTGWTLGDRTDRTNRTSTLQSSIEAFFTSFRPSVRLSSIEISSIYWYSTNHTATTPKVHRNKLLINK